MWFLKSSHVMHLLFILSFFVDHPHNRTVTKLRCNEIFHYYLLSIKTHLFKKSSKRKFNSYSEEFMYIVRLDTVFGSITIAFLYPFLLLITFYFHLVVTELFEKKDSSSSLLVTIFWVELALESWYLRIVKTNRKERH